MHVRRTKTYVGMVESDLLMHLKSKYYSNLNIFGAEIIIDTY